MYRIVKYVQKRERLVFNTSYPVGFLIAFISFLFIETNLTELNIIKCTDTLLFPYNIWQNNKIRLKKN